MLFPHPHWVHLQPEGCDVTIVCLGDSLTYGYEVSRQKVWTALAREESGVPFINRGVNGLMTAGMLACFNRDVIGEKAGAVLLMGGANDILSGLGPAEPEKNMAVMIDRAKEAGITPLVGIPIPFCPPIREDWAAMADFPERTPVYERYVENLRDLAEAKACAVVDFRAGLAEHARLTGIAQRALYGDGIHLNEEGHRVFAAILLRTLRALELV